MNGRFWQAWRWKQRNREIDEEIASHLRMAEQDRIERGAAPREAAAAARRELGNATLVREATRDQRRYARARRALEDLLQDLRFAMRTLRKNRGFALTVIITLGLGIGLNSVFFCAVTRVISPELPLTSPGGLAVILIGKVSQGWNRRLATPAEFSAWRENTGAFSEMAAAKTDSLVLTGHGEPERVAVERVTPNYFHVLGASPALGRTFTPGENASKQQLDAVLGYDLWQRKFGADPKILGHTIELSGLIYTIIGVMPARFRYVLESCDVWTPAALGAQAVDASARQNRELLVVGRLTDGVTIERSRTVTTTLEANLAREYTGASGWAPEILALRDYHLSRNSQLSQRLLMAVAAIVLLIVCANVGGIFLARCTTRRGEFAVRAALGAGPGRVIRQLLAEALLLGIAGGGTAAVVITLWISQLTRIAGWTKGGILQVDADILLVTFAFSLGAVLLFGLAPAIESSKADVNCALKEGGRTDSTGASRHRMRGVFVVVQIAMAVILTVGAGTMARMILQEWRAPRGFQPKGVLAMEVSLFGDSYAAPSRRSAFFREALERFRNLPGVEAAAATQLLPVGGEGDGISFELVGRPAATPSQPPLAVYCAVSPDYFRVMQIPLLAGRVFSDADRDGAPSVVIVNRALANQYFKDVSPVGKSLRLFYSGAGSKPEVAEIAGTVGDVAAYIDGSSEAQIYVPFLQRPEGDMTLVVRTSRDPAGLTPALRGSIWAIDKNQPIGRAVTMPDFITERGGGDWNFGRLLTALTALALGLAALGIYGVIANIVAQRTHEIGLRMALGAQKIDIFRLVIGRGMLLTGIGLAAGMVVSSAFPGLLARAYHDPQVTGGLLLVIAPLLILVAALLACWIPARRAMRVDPMVALRHE